MKAWSVGTLWDCSWQDGKQWVEGDLKGPEGQAGSLLDGERPLGPACGGLGGAPREEREFVKTGGMTGTSDWLVRAILFPGCHSSHFLGLSVMKLITLFSNNPCN